MVSLSNSKMHFFTFSTFFYFNHECIVHVLVDSIEMNIFYVDNFCWLKYEPAHIWTPMLGNSYYMVFDSQNVTLHMSNQQGFCSFSSPLNFSLAV